ncbi:MAG: hypothetical protein K2K19_00230 [Acetatifactor sp.]|nr:hypothetical protein [Acetatifactor sp.]
MRKKRIGIIISIVVILALALLALYLYRNSRPGVYAEKTRYTYNLYCIDMNEEGQFTVKDILIRHNGNYLLASGKYYLYKSKLVLIDSHGDIKLVFVADGDNWVFKEDKSFGLDVLKIKMDDQTIWEPW